MKKLILFACVALCSLFPLTGRCDNASKEPKPSSLDIPATPSQEADHSIPSTAPPLPAETMPAPISYEAAFMKMLLCLAGILLLVFFTAWVLRRLSQGRSGFLNGQKAIKVLEKRSLSPKSVLYLIEVEGQKVLISESQLEVRALTSAPLQTEH